MTAEQQFENLNHLMAQMLASISQFAEESRVSSQRVDAHLAQLSQEVSQLGQEVSQLGKETRSLTQKLDLQNDQIARMTEAITMSRLDFTEIRAITDRQAATAERQEQNITRLVGVVEALVQRPIT